MMEREQRRLVNHRLAVLKHAEEVTGNVSQTCRYYGISRPTFYKWLNRYEEKGLEGLRDRSSRPHFCPHATNAEVVGKIIYLRQNYHFGPAKIAMYLKRYHDITISDSGVWRILQRLDLNRLPASQKHKTYQRRWKRYEKPQPGHAVQVDVKFITPVGGAGKRFYQFTAIDDCTRLRVLRIYPKCNQKTAIQFLDYLLAKLPFRVDVIQTDNGGEFGTQFHYHVLDRGISHVYIKPATPRLNGKVERSHRIDNEEFYRMLDGMVIDDAQLFNDKLQEWEDFYNFTDPTAPQRTDPIRTVKTEDDIDARLTTGQDQELRARCNPPPSVAQRAQPAPLHTHDSGLTARASFLNVKHVITRL